MKCFDNVPLENISSCVNDELVAGTSETEIYIGIADQIATDAVLPPLGTASSTLASLGTLTGDIAFDANTHGFFKLKVQSETGELKDELVGNKGNKKVKSSFDFYLPNTAAEQIGFMRQFKNVGLVVLVTEKSGRVRKLGSKIAPVYMESAAMTTGKGPEDDTGTQYTLSTTSSTPAPIYTGAIPVPA